jgi:hypothetical protein
MAGLQPNLTNHMASHRSRSQLSHTPLSKQQGSKKIKFRSILVLHLQSPGNLNKIFQSELSYLSPTISVLLYQFSYLSPPVSDFLSQSSSLSFPISVPLSQSSCISFPISVLLSQSSYLSPPTSVLYQIS